MPVLALVVPPGVATVDFRIHDHHTKDNAGSLTLDIYKVRPPEPVRVAL